MPPGSTGCYCLCISYEDKRMVFLGPAAKKDSVYITGSFFDRQEKFTMDGSYGQQFWQGEYPFWISSSLFPE